MGAEVDYQVAAPAESRTPNLHRAKQSLTKECGWKDGDRGGPAQTQNLLGGKTKTDLTLTGLLMEGLGSISRLDESLIFSDHDASMGGARVRRREMNW